MSSPTGKTQDLRALLPHWDRRGTKETYALMCCQTHDEVTDGLVRSLRSGNYPGDDFNGAISESKQVCSTKHFAYHASASTALLQASLAIRVAICDE